MCFLLVREHLVGGLVIWYAHYHRNGDSNQSKRGWKVMQDISLRLCSRLKYFPCSNYIKF